jgi:hypothetical protein
MKHSFPPAWIILPLLLLAGCGSTPSRPDPAPTGLSPRGAPEPVSTIPLLVSGEPVPWSVLTPMLAEAAGGTVVEELALESALRSALRAQGRAIGDEDIQRERARWLELLESEDVPPAAETQIRVRRGLGPERFRRLLWRNAALRALIEPGEIAVTDDELALARQIRRGERFSASGSIFPDANAAVRTLERIRADARGVTPAFWSTVATRDAPTWHGIISPFDPAYPDALRRAIRSTPPGQMTGVIGGDDGFTIVLVHAVVPPAPEAPGDDDALRRELETRKSRLAMERLAERLLATTSTHAMDRHLSWGE